MYKEEGEFRHITIGDNTRAELEAPKAEGEGKRVIRGRIPFGGTQLLASSEETWDNKNYYERFAPDVITSLPYKSCMLLRQHNPDSILGREGTSMSVRMEGTELVFEATEIEGSQFFRDTYALVQAGIITGMSFHMAVRSADRKEEGNNITFTITKLTRMDEISLVTRPAYDGTVAQTRSKTLEQIREYETNFTTQKKVLPNKAAILAAM